MPLKGFLQDVVSYATLVEGLCETGRIDEALELFREMKRPDMHTYVALVKGFCDAGRGKEGLCMLQKMKELGWRPSTRAYAALVDLWCRERMVDEAEKMMEGDGLAADQYTCNALIDALCKDGKIDEACSSFDGLEDKGIRLNSVTFNTLMDGLWKAGKVDAAQTFLEKMMSAGCSPDTYT